MAKSRFHSQLEQKVMEAIETRVQSMADGAVADYPQYQFNVGYLRGLKDALKIADDIEGEFEQ